nr:MAG: coat protein [Leviviridae sp.]
MFAEPLEITVGTTEVELPRVTMEKFRSGWGDPSDPISATISHRLGSTESSMVRIDNKKIVEDPLVAGRSVPVQAAAWLNVVAPQNQFGFTDEELKNLINGLIGLLETPGFLDKLLTKQS